MSEDTIWVAKKFPYSQGEASCAFRDEQDAHNWLQRRIKQEPDIETYQLINNDIISPDYSYLVAEGVGKVAGTITEYPVTEGFDSENRRERPEIETQIASHGGDWE